MRIALTGSTGLIGTAVRAYFKARGNTVVALHRGTGASASGIFWDISSRRLDPAALENFDAVIHLAGANLGARRWTHGYKMEILKSRVEGTRLLSETLSRLKNPPKVLLSASAVGFYGNVPAPGQADETTPPGDSFLARVCQLWEEAAELARQAGIRVVCLRFGMVLSGQGGALAKMLPVFKMGLGGPLGSGRQMMSWVALEEVPRIMGHLLAQEGLAGAVNVVAPQPVNNAAFSRTLARALKRPAFFPVPAAAVNLLFGEMGRELLLGGAAVFPKRLKESGYAFRFPDLEMTLRNCL